MVCSPSRSQVSRLSITVPKSSSSLIQTQVPLAYHTSYRVGGKAEFYAAPKTRDEAEACLEWYADHQGDFPLMILGAGSNLLISDRGLPGLTLNMRQLCYYHAEEEGGILVASAGEPIARLAWNAAKRGWRGLEWAVGIPGTVGGSVVMNAGAHQGCVADVLHWVKILEPNGTVVTLQPKDLGYRYRTSNLQGGDRLVLEAAFKLKPGSSKAEVRAETNRNLQMRKSTQPYNLPSCGSVFRNPSPQAAGHLIEGLGLKGYRIGGAQVSERHANFIVNSGDASAQDIYDLIRHVQREVQFHQGILLHTEVKIVGDFS